MALGALPLADTLGEGVEESLPSPAEALGAPLPIALLLPPADPDALLTLARALPLLQAVPALLPVPLPPLPLPLGVRLVCALALPSALTELQGEALPLPRHQDTEAVAQAVRALLALALHVPVSEAPDALGVPDRPTMLLEPRALALRVPPCPRSAPLLVG